MDLKYRAYVTMNRVLGRLGLQLMRASSIAELEHKHRVAVALLAHQLSVTDLPDLPITDDRLDRLADLIGTEPGEGLFILDTLLKALSVEGDVCEFGVAQGATSSLLAAELLGTDRKLWLYDSFAGLPAPTGEDELIDDVLGLGSMDAYTGAMSFSSDRVRDRLKRVGLPPRQYHIYEGFVTDALPPEQLPDQVAFAYLDFDLYRPIRDALNLVHSRLCEGGYVIVDDYGYLSAGVALATDEFYAEHRDEYELERPPGWAGHCARFRRLRSPR